MNKIPGDWLAVIMDHPAWATSRERTKLQIRVWLIGQDISFYFSPVCYCPDIQDRGVYFGEEQSTVGWTKRRCRNIRGNSTVAYLWSKQFPFWPPIYIRKLRSQASQSTPNFKILGDDLYIWDDYLFQSDNLSRSKFSGATFVLAANLSFSKRSRCIDSKCSRRTCIDRRLYLDELPIRLRPIHSAKHEICIANQMISSEIWKKLAQVNFSTT